MTIKYNWQDLQKRIINGKEVEKVMYNGVQIRPSSTPVSDDYLCFTSLEANNQLGLARSGSPTTVQLEISTDKSTWSDYTIWTNITLANIWDKLYWRNKSETMTGFSSYNGNYEFTTSWKFAVSWDVNYLLCKNNIDVLHDYIPRKGFFYLFARTKITSAPKIPALCLSERCYDSMFYLCQELTTPPVLPATDLADWCYMSMFAGCSSLSTPPRLPATQLWNREYDWMFADCTSLSTLPELPATYIWYISYREMFAYCPNIKLSTTQTWEYQTPYRIPSSWMWSEWPNAMTNMFLDTWWTFTGTPSINTTYYTSNPVI